MDYEVVTKDGSKRILEVSSSLVKDAEGRAIGFRGIARDVTEQRQTARALRESEQKFKTLAEATSSAIMIYQGEKFVYTNPAAELITGYTKNELQSMKFWEFVHPDYRETIKSRGHARQQGELPPQRYEFKIVTKTGEEKWLDFTGDLIELNNAPAGILTAFDITERKRMEEELRRLTLLDDLTGIANRRHFEEVFDMEWKRALREGNSLSLLMCDIDYFKSYNDLYGHQKGDECLQKVAAAVKSVSRRPGDLAARYGGEEFVILLPSTNSQGAKEMAKKIRTGIEELGIMNPDSPAAGRLTISIGVATFIPDRLSSPDNLLCDADAALYEAKRRGRNMTLAADAIRGERPQLQGSKFNVQD
jgi:diguanylate cyclase (GGDEF)-like protein/PAS domain S-box-containing protein